MSQIKTPYCTILTCTWHYSLRPICTSNLKAGWFVISRLGFTMVNLCTKFEISIYTSYEDMKGGAFRWLGANQGHRQCHHSPFDTAQQRIWFLFNFNGNYASISYRFPDTASYLSKFANFNPHHLRLAPPLRWPRCIFAEIFGVRKLDLAIVWRCFCDQCIATYENTACDRQRQTDRAYIALA